MLTTLQGVRSLGSSLLFLVVLAAALITRPSFASNSDEGPREAVAAVRHDVPILLADMLAASHVQSALATQWVVTDGRQAVVEWRSGHHRGVIVLRFRTGRWWWRGAASNDPSDDQTWAAMNAPGTSLSLCGGSHFGPPSAHDLLVQGFISAPLAARVSTRLKPTPQMGRIALELCDSFGWSEGSTAEGYVADFDHPGNVQSGRFTFTGRGPADWQRPVTPDSELYYAFTMSTGAPEAATFTAGSTFDVWFPFVLDGRKCFTLRVRHVVPEFEVKSTPVNNALHFKLPAFEIQKGIVAQGEIDAENIMKN